MKQIPRTKCASSTSSAPVAVLGCTFSAAILVAACCPFGVWHIRTSVAGYDDTGYGNPPPAFQVGDTVQFLAEEGFFEATCRTPAPPSNRAPYEYRWKTSGPNAESLGNGLVAMRGFGEFQLSTATAHVDDVTTHQIVSRVAGIRLTPDSVLLDVGDTISFLVEAIDVNGGVIAELNRASGLLRLHGEPSDWSDPIAANQADSDGVHFLWRAYRPGLVTLRAGVAVYGTESVTASATILVRSN